MSSNRQVDDESSEIINSMKMTRSTTQDRIGPSVADRVLTIFALLLMIVLGIADSPETDSGLLVLLTIAGWAPLLLRHRWPVVSLALVLAVDSVHIAVVPLAEPIQFTSIPVATMIACYTIAARFPWRSAWLYGGFAALVLLLFGTFTRDGERVAANAFALDLVLGAIGAGVLIRSRYQRLEAMERRAVLAERTKEDEAKRQVASERLRMARELHDVVAHTLALVNAQSSVAAYLIRTDPKAAEKALLNLTEHTKLALDELRATVGLLRQVDDDADELTSTGGPDDLDGLGPVPGLPELPVLIDRHGAMPGGVSLTVEGASRPVTTSTALAAYRIIQEALTNARKHAPGATARVRLDWRPEALDVQIFNDAPPPGDRPPVVVGTGHGLLGMRERALATHGTLTAGEQSDGGWLVSAHLPLDSGQQETP